MTDHQHHGVGWKKKRWWAEAPALCAAAACHHVTTFLLRPTNALMLFHPERRTDGEWRADALVTAHPREYL